MAGLKARFETFVKTLDGFELIDDLLRGSDVPGRKRADYLFNNREIIVEQKSLEVDPTHKPQRFVNKLMDEGRFVMFGTLSTKAIFDKLPDGAKLNRDLVLKITKVIQDIVSKADKQTKDTRESFSIPNATGILIILNESARMLSPDIIHYALANQFQKTIDGSLRYPHNNGVILISEAHVADIQGPKIFPILTFSSPHGQGRTTVENFSSMIRRRWADFNGARLYQGEIPNYRAL
jgi:hypothetical protein